MTADRARPRPDVVGDREPLPVLGLGLVQVRHEVRLDVLGHEPVEAARKDDHARSAAGTGDLRRCGHAKDATPVAPASEGRVS